MMQTMGPFAAVYQIWKTSQIPKSTPVPEWILVIGEQRECPNLTSVVTIFHFLIP